MLRGEGDCGAVVVRGVGKWKNGIEALKVAVEGGGDQAPAELLDFILEDVGARDGKKELDAGEVPMMRGQAHGQVAIDGDVGDRREKLDDLGAPVGGCVDYGADNHGVRGHAQGG